MKLKQIRELVREEVQRLTETGYGTSMNAPKQVPENEVAGELGDDALANGLVDATNGAYERKGAEFFVQGKTVYALCDGAVYTYDPVDEFWRYLVG